MTDARGVVHKDADFARYADSGPYHWDEIGRVLPAHTASTVDGAVNVPSRLPLRRPRLFMVQVVVAENVTR